VPSPRRKLTFTTRRIAALAGVVFVAATAYAFLRVGRFVAVEDPLQPADAIFVFAGTYAERPLEAYDLYRSGWAPRLVVTRATVEQATFELERRGVRIPTEHDLTRDALLRLGVPASAVIAPSFVHDSTAEEARTLGELVREHRWRRVILVSSKYHMRRVKLAAGRYLQGTNVQLIARGSRYDPSTPDRWWTRRADIRWLASEVPKLIAYALGLGM
jgi:uncharacterized SAM-binding protein YcdF (DUF218 family)